MRAHSSIIHSRKRKLRHFSPRPSSAHRFLFSSVCCLEYAGLFIDPTVGLWDDGHKESEIWTRSCHRNQTCYHSVWWCHLGFFLSQTSSKFWVCSSSFWKRTWCLFNSVDILLYGTIFPNKVTNNHVTIEPIATHSSLDLQVLDYTCRYQHSLFCITIRDVNDSSINRH